MSYGGIVDEPTRPRGSPAFRLIAVAASLGGLEAMTRITRRLPPEFATPVILVQHGRPRRTVDRLPELLGRNSRQPVRSAEDGASAYRPGITVVPRGYDAVLDEQHRFRLTESDGIGDADRLFRSVADAVGPAAIGVVLTGMLHDGADGIRAIKARGGRGLAQDPQTARAGAMPSHALATGCVDFALSADRIADALIALTMAPGGADLFRVPTPHWARLPA